MNVEGRWATCYSVQQCWKVSLLFLPSLFFFFPGWLEHAQYRCPYLVRWVASLVCVCVCVFFTWSALRFALMTLYMRHVDATRHTPPCCPKPGKQLRLFRFFFVSLPVYRPTPPCLVSQNAARRPILQHLYNTIVSCSPPACPVLRPLFSCPLAAAHFPPSELKASSGLRFLFMSSKTL